MSLGRAGPSVLEVVDDVLTGEGARRRHELDSEVITAADVLAAARLITQHSR